MITFKKFFELLILSNLFIRNTSVPVAGQGAHNPREPYCSVPEFVITHPKNHKCSQEIYNFCYSDSNVYFDQDYPIKVDKVPTDQVDDLCFMVPLLFEVLK